MRGLLISSCVLTLTGALLANPFAGRWGFELPGGGRFGWLGVEEKGGQLESAVLWGGGSVTPANETKVEDGKLLVIRHHKQKDGTVHKQVITVSKDGENLTLTTQEFDGAGKPKGKSQAFKGVKCPDLPKAPDLAAIKYGAPVTLFSGSDMGGWVAMDEKAFNGWSVKDGILSNRVMQPDGKAKHGTNLKTTKTFEDFNLKTELRVPKNGNSGIYLRGIYEVQVRESYGMKTDPHNLGALYSRITPCVAAEKPAGEWQTLDITLCDRHLTVVLNGQKIIDNEPVLGITGGAMSCDETAPGPIYLQGDHTDVDYRNMVLTPIVK